MILYHVGSLLQSASLISMEENRQVAGDSLGPLRRPCPSDLNCSLNSSEKEPRLRRYIFIALFFIPI
jgi:hypothetical protein